VEEWEKEFRKEFRRLCSEAWESACATMVAEIDTVVSDAIGDTEADPETHSRTMSTPTHTDIAKDFDADQHLVDEEGHEHEEDHEHRHGGAWLAPLASVLATKASAALLAEFRAGCEAVEAGDPPPDLGDTVDEWFCHPEDCRERWETEVMDALEDEGPRGDGLREELARRTALPAPEQAPSEHAHH
jgi:hypothetical protein